MAIWNSEARCLDEKEHKRTVPVCWIIMLILVVKLARYIFLASFAACGLARYDSRIAIRVSDGVRTVLLIFSHAKEKISVLAVICQCCTYAVVFASILFQVITATVCVETKTLYAMVNAIDWVVRVQLLGLVPIGLLEEWVCWLRKRT